MRRRVTSVAGLAILFGVLLLCFGATVGLADRCKADEHGGHGHGPGKDGGDGDCPDVTVPTTVPATDPPTTPATEPAPTPATTPATTPAPPPLRAPHAPAAATSPAPAPTAARSPASASPDPRRRIAATASPTTVSKKRDAAPPRPAAEPQPAAPQLEASTTTAPSLAELELASAGEQPTGLRSGPTLLPTLALVTLGGLLFAAAYWFYVTLLGRR